MCDIKAMELSKGYTATDNFGKKLTPQILSCIARCLKAALAVLMLGILSRCRALCRMNVAISLIP